MFISASEIIDAHVSGSYYYALWGGQNDAPTGFQSVLYYTNPAFAGTSNWTLAKTFSLSIVTRKPSWTKSDKYVRSA